MKLPLVYFLSLFLLLLSIVSCQKQQAPALEVAQPISPTEAYNQSPANSSEYFLKWGDITLPLEKYANPNGFRGEIEVEREQMLQALDQQLELLKNNQPLNIELHTLYNYTNHWRHSQWHQNPAANQRKLDAAVVEELRTAIDKGDEVVLHLSSTNKDVYVAGAKIKIKDPYQAYVQEKSLSWTRPNPEAFGFQVISQEGKESVLRIDTTSQSTQKVYDLYKDRKDYKILHIPNFETQRRLVIDEDDIFSKYEIRRTELFDNEFDRWTLSEFTDYYRRNVILEWGKMKAQISSENYSLATFSNNHKKELSLTVGERTIPVIGFDLLIKSADEPPIRFITSSLAVAEIEQSLASLPARSSVYFTNLIVDDAGTTKHFPINFAFNFDDPLAFDLDIAEVELLETTESLVSDYSTEDSDTLHQISYKNYLLSDLVAQLTGLDKDAIFFSTFKENPVVNVCFASPTLPTEYGKKAIQRALEKQYNIRLFWSWYDFYELQAPIPELLAGYRYKDDADNIRQFTYELDNETKIAELRYANLYQMASRVGNEFRIAIVNNTELEGAYEMSLDMSSVNQLKTSLMDNYGLELTKLSEEIDLVVYQMEID